MKIEALNNELKSVILEKNEVSQDYQIINSSGDFISTISKQDQSWERVS